MDKRKSSLPRPPAGLPSSVQAAVSEQVRQRQAVREMLQRRNIRIVREVYSTDRPTVSRVSVRGEQYDVGETDLALLASGRSPTWLGLSPVSQDDEA
jgi:hypothetical protein